MSDGEEFSIFDSTKWKKTNLSARDELLPVPDQQELAAKIKDLLEFLGLPLDDVHFQETPKRVAKMLIKEVCSGLYNKAPKLKMFPGVNGHGSLEMEGIPIKSLCPHHLLPVIGFCKVRIKTNVDGLPLIGMSKIPRLVSWWARRPITQEKLANCIIDDLMHQIQEQHVKEIGIILPLSVHVRIEARHMCMEFRGIQEDPVTVVDVVRSAEIKTVGRIVSPNETTIN